MGVKDLIFTFTFNFDFFYPQFKVKISCSFLVMSYIVCFIFFILYLHAHRWHPQVITRRLEFDFGNSMTLFLLSDLTSIENRQKLKFLEVVKSSSVKCIPRLFVSSVNMFRRLKVSSNRIKFVTFH